MGKKDEYRWFIVSKNGDTSPIFPPYPTRLRALMKTTEAIYKAVSACGINNGATLELWRMNENGGCYTLKIPIRE